MIKSYKKLYFFVFLFVIIVVILFYKINISKTGKENIKNITSDYKTNVKSLTEINLKELNKLILKNDKIALYVGRESCPHCRMFVKKLSLVSGNYKIYYLDSVTDYDHSPEDLKKFRDEYSIEYVPQLLLFKQGKIISRLDIQDTTEPSDILKFLKKLDL
jgi:predicted bacteriocin transport accessory protein